MEIFWECAVLGVLLVTGIVAWLHLFWRIGAEIIGYIVDKRRKAAEKRRHLI